MARSYRAPPARSVIELWPAAWGPPTPGRRTRRIAQMAANIERHEIEPLFDGAANDLFSVRPDWLAAGCGWMWHSVALTWDFLA